ncbi:MAG: ABC transporter permease, partial [Ensifer adhaerens]
MTAIGTSVSAPKRRRSLALTVGLALVGLNVAVAVLTLFWTPYDPLNASGGRLEAPSLLHWLGTDRLGRDLLTQLMIGARTALLVGTGAVVIGAAIGVSLGVLAAFATRLADDVMAATLDILIAFPTLL